MTPASQPVASTSRRQLPATSPSPPRQTWSSNDWQYEMRREAQLIIPNLYLGPFQAAAKLDRMKDLGITHVLCVRDKREKGIIFPRFPHQFAYHVLEISDDPDQNIIRLIPECLEFIESAIAAGGTVLAHCNGGIALSPAIVVAYLMVKFNWTFNAAIDYVQAKRYCASPMNFSIQLKEYEPIFHAMRSLEKNGVWEITRTNKRELEDDAEDAVLDERRSAHAPHDPRTIGTMDTT